MKDVSRSGAVQMERQLPQAATRGTSALETDAAAIAACAPGVGLLAASHTRSRSAEDTKKSPITRCERG